MSELTLKDTLDYLKFIVSENSRNYVVGTLPRVSLIFSFTIGCVYAVLTSGNASLVKFAALGVVLSILLNVASFYSAFKLQKQLNQIVGICESILAGEIKTSSDAIAKYRAVRDKSLRTLVNEQIESEKIKWEKV